MNVCLQCQFSVPSTGTFCPSCGASLHGASPFDEGLVGETIDQTYHLHRSISFGLVSDLYLARDTKRNQIYALKMYKGRFCTAQPNPAFLQEAAQLQQASSQNPHLVQFFASGFVPNAGHYITMEYLKGAPLSRLIAPGSRMLSLPRILSILIQLCSALKTLHEAGLHHQELDPDNVFLIKHDGQDGFVKLLDPVMARSLQPLEETSTTPIELPGIPHLMAPEQLFPPAECQLRGWPIDHRVDVYGVGILLYKLITGVVPFRRKQKQLDAESWADWRKALENPPKHPQAHVPKRRIPASVVDIAMQALKANPNDRFPTIDALAEALLKAAKQLEAAGPRLTTTRATANKDSDSPFSPQTSSEANTQRAMKKLRQTGEYTSITRVGVTESGDPNGLDVRIEELAVPAALHMSLPGDDDPQEASTPGPAPVLPDQLSANALPEIISWGQLFDGPELPEAGELYVSDEVTDSFQESDVQMVTVPATQLEAPLQTIPVPQAASSPFDSPVLHESPSVETANLFPSTEGVLKFPPGTPIPPSRAAKGPPPASLPTAGIPMAPPTSGVLTAPTAPAPAPSAPRVGSLPSPHGGPPAPPNRTPSLSSLAAPFPSMPGSPMPGSPLPPLQAQPKAPGLAASPFPVDDNPLHGPSLEFVFGQEPDIPLVQTANAPPSSGFPKVAPAAPSSTSNEADVALSASASDGPDEPWEEEPNRKPILILGALGVLFTVLALYFFFLGPSKPPTQGTPLVRGKNPTVAPMNRQGAAQTNPTRALVKARTNPGRDVVTPRSSLRVPAPRTRYDFGMKTPSVDRPPPRRVIERQVDVVVRRRAVKRRIAPVLRRRATALRRIRRTRAGCRIPSNPSLRVIRLRSKGLSLSKIDVRSNNRLYRPDRRGCLRIPVDSRLLLLSYKADVTAYHLCQVQLSARRQLISFRLVDANTVPPNNNDCSR